MGSFCNAGKRFVVKLDTEAKAENATARNMVVVGGPVANMLSSEINPMLKIQFKWKNGWSIFSAKTKREFNGDYDGILAKLRNPWDKEKAIVLIAGLKFEGTKSCIIALTQFYKEVLKNYDKNKNFYCLIRGQDLDGDGKVDSVKILESWAD